jgi:hypothetical protein
MNRFYLIKPIEQHCFCNDFITFRHSYAQVKKDTVAKKK